MAVREVKFKIDVKGIVEACLSFGDKYEIDEYIEDYDKVRHLDFLKEIFNENLEIESAHYSNEESGDILNIIKNNMYLYFIYTNIPIEESLRNLYSALKSRDKDLITRKAVNVIKKIIGLNLYIYNPDHGINKKIDMYREQETIGLVNKNYDLSPREYTLEIDDTNLPSLKSISQSTSEGLDREKFIYISDKIKDIIDMEILKKYSPIETYHSLDDLYTLKKDGVLLVDYGLELIHEKYHEIKDLFQTIKQIKLISKSQKDIIEHISDVFTPENLKIVISICDNAEEIMREKKIHGYVINALEYMMSKTDFLKETDSSENTLKIKPDLSNFREDYLSNKNNLKKLVNERINRLPEEYREICDSPTIKTEENASNYMQNSKELLQWKLDKEDRQHGNCVLLLISLGGLSSISPIQKQYLLRKLKEFGEIWNIKVIIDREEAIEEVIEEEKKAVEVPTEKQPRQANRIKILMVSAIVLAAVTFLFLAHSRGAVKLVSANY
ncbi:hypothetical protein NEMIN01_2113 [Nematocida minor]|uniref:uncharacterized protein n=1 Tax=Nematocida minor TaxID=1912983 RepID=UPI0022209233|nr:uncharacterized protein NEMIN01_2113 [Nematocida minor]KAI5192614.1 hypothetical protein NEMIN01_2113 [Nematocida minor]